jgi:hypothetical protein
MSKWDCIAIMPDLRDFTVASEFRTCHAEGLSAVLAPAPRGMILTRRQVVRSAAGRQARLEALMAHGTILPVMPGRSMTEVVAHSMLKANAALFSGRLAALHGRVQFQVTLEIAQNAEPPRAARSLIPGGADQEDIGPAVARHLEASLSAIADDIRVLPRAGAIVCNLVVLLDVARVAELDGTLAGFDALWPDGFRFRLIGPSPAVSFASVALQPVEHADLVAARRLLEVAEGASSDVIAAARTRALRKGSGVSPDLIREAAAMLRCAHAAGLVKHPILRARIWSEGMADSRRVALREVA